MINIKVLCDSATLAQLGFQDLATLIVTVFFFFVFILFINIGDIFRPKPRLPEVVVSPEQEFKNMVFKRDCFGRIWEVNPNANDKSRVHLISANVRLSCGQGVLFTSKVLGLLCASHPLYRKQKPHTLIIIGTGTTQSDLEKGKFIYKNRFFYYFGTERIQCYDCFTCDYVESKVNCMLTDFCKAYENKNYVLEDVVFILLENPVPIAEFELNSFTPVQIF